MISSRLRAVWVSAALLSTFAAACSDDDGSLNPADHPAALLTEGDFDTASTISEVSNLMFALQQAGFPLDTAEAVDSTTIAGLITGKEILFIGETDPAFDPGTQQILKDFVDEGGIIVLVGGYVGLGWVNATFGWSLTASDDWNDQSPMPRLAGAAGTPFAGGPFNIAANDGGSSLDIPSLPEGARAIYGGPEGGVVASVAAIPSGSGWVVYFGWDWYDGAPYGEQDGGWRNLLRRTASF